MKSDLTVEEQTHVRTALRFLRVRCGSWANVGKVLGFQKITLAHVSRGRTVSASLAVRLARVVGVTVDDVLTGHFPAPGACPHCGHVREPAAPSSTCPSPAFPV